MAHFILIARPGQTQPAAVEIRGFHAYAGTVAVISVSLAIVNLLPVPALDGGQITVFLFEWIRGRPLSAEVRMRIQMVGVIVLFTLLIMVTANDITRLIFPESY